MNTKLTGNIKYRVIRGIFSDKVILQVEENYLWKNNSFLTPREEQRTRWRDAIPEDLQFLRSND